MKYRLHTAGPDDIDDYDNELEALRVANNINKQFLLVNEGHWDDGQFVLCVATVEVIPDRQLPHRRHGINGRARDKRADG